MFRRMGVLVASAGLGALLLTPVGATIAGASAAMTWGHGAHGYHAASAGTSAQRVHTNASSQLTQPGAPTDARGNPVNQPNAAATALGIGYLGNSLVLDLKSGGTSNPLTDPAWSSPYTFIEWDLFPTATPAPSDLPSYVVQFGVRSGQLVGVLAKPDASGNLTLVNCPVAPTSPSPGSYRVALNATCIGNPQRVNVGAAVSYDAASTDTTGAQADTDQIPEGNPLLGADAFDDVNGYWMFARDGGVFSEGSAVFHGSLGGIKLNAPVVGGASSPDGRGYWMVGSDGGVFAFGDAGYYGSEGGQRLNRPIVAIAPTPTGHGYWLIARDGGVFSFGDAVYQGSEGGQPLDQPVVGGFAAIAGQGYYLVASDGGVFSFGSAVFRGSQGGSPLNQPIVGGARSTSGKGYYLVASDGGVFTHGDAAFGGSTGGMRLNQPVVGLSVAMTGSTAGYRLVASDGGIFTFNTSFEGSTGDVVLNQPIVGMATAANA